MLENRIGLVTPASIRTSLCLGSRKVRKWNPESFSNFSCPIVEVITFDTRLTLYFRQRKGTIQGRSICRYNCRGGSRGRTRRAPLKLKKIWFFGVKSWFFTRNTPTISRFPPLGAIFLSAPPPPKLKSWIRPCYTKNEAIN